MTKKINNIIVSSVIILMISVIGSCKKQEIEIYNQTPRVDFAVINERLVFNDTTYLKNITSLDFGFHVNLVGFAQAGDLKFSVKPKSDDDTNPPLDITFFNPYTMPANAYSAKAHIKISRPKEFDTPQTITLKFEDFNETTHQFHKGRIEQEQMNVNVIFQINPGNWDNQTFGVYSNGKYAFIMDIMKKTYKDIEKNDATRIKLYEAYKAYLQNNDSIMDDSNPPRGIVFPQF